MYVLSSNFFDRICFMSPPCSKLSDIYKRASFKAKFTTTMIVISN